MSEFALLTKVQAAIEKASSVADAKLGRDQAETLRAYAKLTGESLEVQNECAEVKIRYERKGGELIASMPKSKGAAATRDHDDRALEVVNTLTTSSLEVNRDASRPAKNDPRSQ